MMALLGLAGCSGVAMNDPASVAQSYVRHVAAGEFDAACELTVEGPKGEREFRTEDSQNWQACLGMAQDAHDFWEESGLLDRALDAESGPLSTDKYGEEFIGFADLGSGRGDWGSELHLIIEPVGDEWGVNDYYLPGGAAS